ncbi:hypothetical protein LUZ60_008193 [Juncus effusus]|nr:hypothetical protein LUZ60_008193 [Juncus effusus]
MDSANASSSSVSSGCKRKRSIGRQKIAIEPIQNEPARQVCFSKRRNGLFKRVQELAVLCGAHIKIVVFSPAGKPYSYIHSSDSSTLNCHMALPDRPSKQDQKIQFSELEFSLKAAKKRKAVVLKGLCGADVAMDDVSQDELDAVLMRARAELVFRKNELSIMPYLVPVQEPVPVQDGYGNDGFYCGYSDAELFSLDDFNFGGDFGLWC